MRQAFDFFDESGGGQITMEELEEGFRKLKVQMPDCCL